MGFGVPISRWFRNELRNELCEVLLDPVCLHRGLFRDGFVEKLIREHLQGTREHALRSGLSCTRTMVSQAFRLYIIQIIYVAFRGEDNLAFSEASMA